MQKQEGLFQRAMTNENKNNRNIAIVWDFDNTLTPEDSTSITVDIVTGESGASSDFWDTIKIITGKTRKPEWKELLGSHAPAWMHALSRIASNKRIPLNEEFFREFVLDKIKLYPNVIEFLTEIKNLEKTKPFKNLKIEIHHFIVSAGLEDLVKQVFPKDLITQTFGCRYAVIADPDYLDEPESIPVFCMDETMKTRSLFEIAKGPEKRVNERVEKKDRFAIFENFIYIGDGPTDIPSLSLTRYNGGLGIVVYDKKTWDDDKKEKLKKMSIDKRADLITPADYSLDGELFGFIKNRCIQICQRYEAENFL